MAGPDPVLKSLVIHAPRSCVPANESYAVPICSESPFLDRAVTTVMEKNKELFKKCLESQAPAEQHDEKTRTCPKLAETDKFVLKEVKISDGFPFVVHTNGNRSLQKCATFPGSEVEKDSFFADKNNKMDTGIQCCQLISPAYGRSFSLPASGKLIPAIKGSRERTGVCLQEKLHVKWAPDVYDPPVTSASHTANANARQKQRSKPKKKEKKKNKQKRRPSNGNGCKNSVPSETDVISTVPAVLGVLCSNATAEMPLPNRYGKHVEETLDYSSNREALCRGSLLLEAAATMHFSVAEAS